MIGVAAAGGIFAFTRYFARGPPHTMTREYQEASDEYLKVGSNNSPQLIRDLRSNLFEECDDTRNYLHVHRAQMSSQLLVFPPRTGRVASWSSQATTQRNKQFESLKDEVVESPPKVLVGTFVSLAVWRALAPLMCKRGFCGAKDESWCIDKWIIKRTSASNVQRAVSLLVVIQHFYISRLL